MAASTAQCRVAKAESKAAAGPRAGVPGSARPRGCPRQVPRVQAQWFSRRRRLCRMVPRPSQSRVPGPCPRRAFVLRKNTMVAVGLGSPLLPKKSLPVSGTLEPMASRLSSKVAAEVPHGNKRELPDLKAQSLTTCEVCGACFETRRGLSNHARSHLRQMGVTEWSLNGSPIDTLRKILKRRTQSRPGGHLHPPGPSPKALAKVVGSGGPGSSLEARSPSDRHISPLAKKWPPGSPLGHSPTASPPPTARKMFSGLATPSLPKKLKPEQMRVEIKREMLPGALHGEPHPSEGPWGTPREDMAPLNLSSRAEPVRDIRCEFCGEFFKNRKGLSSHARSHLRQMGVTKWSVNGSPIDTLQEILKKKSKLCLIMKEPPAGDLAPALAEDGSPTAAPGAMHSPLPLSPLASRPGKRGAGPAQVPPELSLSPITRAKPSTTSYLGPVATKRPLQEDCVLPAEVKAKTDIQTELPFKAKTLHEKTSHSSTEACCELCGLYFENRKALASHERAHLQQSGVTEEHQRQNINKFERKRDGSPDASAARGGEDANDLQQKLEEVRQPPLRVRPVPSLVPRPPQTSLVKFVGNIYTLKCRFCEVEFQGPLSIQEEWVRHLQRHILEMNVSKADPLPEEPQVPQHRQQL